MPSEYPTYTKSVTTAIRRRADKYLERMGQEPTDKSRNTEADLLGELDRYVAEVLDGYTPPAGRRSRDRLLLADLHELPDTDAEERRRVLVTKLMAAEVESRGPLRLTRAQDGRLAEIYERIGAGCRAQGLHLHAAHAFDRAASLYLALGDSDARDRCLCERTRCRQRPMPFGLRKAMLTLSWLLCGYGYKPYRLLCCVVIQLLVFSVILALVMDKSVPEIIYTCLGTYLNPLGVSDRDGLSHSALIILTVESYVGSISLSVFFALLVHRWFRI